LHVRRLELNEFLNTHVSEDNNAFAQIVVKEREAKPSKPVNPNLPAMLTDAEAALMLEDAAPHRNEKETRPHATRFGTMLPPPVPLRRRQPRARRGPPCPPRTARARPASRPAARRPGSGGSARPR
jgi:hypothetical protein